MAPGAEVQMSPKLRHVVAQPLKLPVLQLAVLFGYIIPGVFMTLPSPQVSTYGQQQVAIVMWVLFPLWVAGLQAGLYTLFTNLVSAKLPPKPTTELGAENIYSLRLVYASAFGLCSIAHIAIISLSMVSFVFPMLFAPGYPSAFHPLRLIFPANPSRASSIGEGSMNFLQWDQWIGYSAALLWAMIQHQNARSKNETARGWMVLLAKVAGVIAIAGPGGALIAVTWARDESVLAVGTDQPKGKTAR
ncbi:MAG: hypothetical protein LQ347_001878 [Umbilicaria vellea]|nr:MAG: hypothetical protein LQ347_001878 [Umbilicaria vellea]